ncbi:Crp/Fnr family transcriptional regulator [Pedobacter miscanthi]|uniref:Crp/Fnr family transcriptional regulator n=1 Tax=Pedobacter miscanthi TaxID=2259170 RepID=A0A366L6J5_9SPHI|nr:Crp/Fnr family transcriptional regulator [Pedobacter miscanthi]RBQ08914.1 hypothetical protein DRW42_06810 [Pedobacter miscanthi]
METKNYFQALSHIDKIPVGMSAYLMHSLKEYRFKRQGKIQAADPQAIFLAYLQHGSARLYAVDRETHEQHTVDFYLPGNFLPLPAPAGHSFQADLYIEFLEESTVLALSEKHFRYLPKLFSECTLLYHKMYSSHLLSQISRMIARENSSADERLMQLSTSRPHLFNVASVKDLASYLGMHPNTLSKLKGNP